MRAAIYARVSSSQQRDAHTIESQMRELPAYVAAQGWDLVATYVDDGRSAKTGQLERRDGFARLMADAEAGRFDVVVVVDVNRLTRTESIEERAQILGPFQRLGIHVATPAGGVLDLRSFLGEFWVTVQALVAAEENRKRAEAVRRGKRTAAARGGKATGRDPYGLRYDKPTNTWSLDPVRAPIVREIYERAATEEKCASIAFDLEVRGIPAPGARGWNKNRVRDIVRSRYAVGEYVAHRKSRTVAAVPAIVDEDLWQRAQDALDYNRTYYRRRTKHTYLLEAIAVCACGAPVRIRSANTTRGRWFRPAHYICSARCGAKLPPTEVADRIAWQEICRRLDDPGLVRELADLDVDQAADAETHDRDAATAQAHLDRLVQVEQTIMARFRRGLISEAALDAELAAIRRERAQATRQLRAATRGRGQALGAKARAQGVSAAVSELREALAAADLEDRRALVLLVVDPGGVRIERDAIVVDLWIPRAPSARAAKGSVSALKVVGCYSDDLGNRLPVRVVAKLAA